MQRGHDQGQDRAVLTESTDNYTISDKAFLALKTLWYRWPHLRTVVMEKTTHRLPCICQGPKELFCYLYISKSNIPNVVEAKFISGTHPISFYFPLSPPTYPALVICFTLLMILPSLLLISLSFLPTSNQPARSRKEPPFPWSHSWILSGNTRFLPSCFQKSSCCICTWI